MTEKIANMLEVLVSEGYSKDDVLEFARKVVDSPEEVFEEYATKNDLKTRIYKILSELGVTPEEISYNFLVKAVEIAYNNPAILDKAALFGLYQEVSYGYPVKAADVRDSITYTIERVWKEMDEGVKMKYFGSRIQRETIRGINLIGDLARYLESQE